MKKPQSILFVMVTLSTGGAERHVSMVSRRLLARGYDVTIFCMRRGGALERETRDAGVKIAGVNLFVRPENSGRMTRMFLNLAAIPWLFFYLLFKRPAFAHFFLPQSYIIGGMLARAAGLKRLVMSRRSLNLYQARHPYLTRLEYRLHKHILAALGNSRRVVQQLRQEGVAPERLGLIYNGVDLDNFVLPENARADVCAELGLEEDTTVMVVVANLRTCKGHADLFRALEIFRDSLPAKWALLVVGRDDGIGDSLKAQLRASGLLDKVHFLGLRKDVVRLLAGADIGILPSHEEGFSNALLEGMAAGLPMVATDVGGNAEAVAHGKTGLIVPPGAPEQLGAAIVSLTGNPERALRMGQAGRQRIENLFSLDACIDNYHALYTGLLAGNPVKDIAGVGVDAASDGKGG